MRGTPRWRNSGERHPMAEGRWSGRGDRAEPVDLIVYGCGTQGRAIIEFLAESGRYPRLCLTDDNRRLWGSSCFSIPVLPPRDAFADAAQPFVCAIGANGARRETIVRLRDAGHLPIAVQHPSAVIAASARVNAGSILMARALVNTEAHVGVGCLLNSGCVVEHHCGIGDFVHLAPGVLLGGGVRVGEGAFLGLGAIVLPGLSVGREAIVGAGAVVTHDVPPGFTVAGNPARILRDRPPGESPGFAGMAAGV